MSIHAIRQYRVELDKIVKYGGTTTETVIRSAFFNLLNEYARQRGWMMLAEISIKTHAGKIVTPDGTLKDSLRLAGKEAQRPHDCRKIQHLPLRRLQRACHRFIDARLRRKRTNHANRKKNGE